MYSTNNFRYLRISKTRVLPLNLLVSKEDLEWFNDYSFQEILTVLKPLLLSRVELYEQGHIVKRTINPTTFVNPYQDLDDGLEDAGVILGGSDDSTRNQGPDSASGLSESSANKEKRRKGTILGNKSSVRPQFAIRYGMRTKIAAERGGAVMVAEKNLGFLKVKKEQDNETNSIEDVGGSQRVRSDLASFGGEEGTTEDADSIVIREEDESDNLRVNDFRREDEVDDDDVEQARSKRKQSAKETRRQSKRKRTKEDEQDVSSSQGDQKPTLQVKYAPLKLHPQTLYIVVRTLGAPAASVSTLPFAPIRAAASSSSSSTAEASGSGTGGSTVAGQQEEEDSLFPSGLDYFMP
ncbi:hypothetical protein BGZ65_012753 [Modicella reniformis]|uniref:Uncharacterized protein n=1 Tax=Modicella reniformis TaxID=1440133 RepID=A0A9P6LTM2_9FUNG|nr:hypothetical protein BGZ65_012753 [Modicella reniformis]